MIDIFDPKALRMMDDDVLDFVIQGLDEMDFVEVDVAVAN